VANDVPSNHRRLWAELIWEPEYAKGTPLDATRMFGSRQSNVIDWTHKQGRSLEAAVRTLTPRQRRAPRMGVLAAVVNPSP
jgi:hypothetical protein